LCQGNSHFDEVNSNKNVGLRTDNRAAESVDNFLEGRNVMDEHSEKYVPTDIGSADGNDLLSQHFQTQKSQHLLVRSREEVQERGKRCVGSSILPNISYGKKKDSGDGEKIASEQVLSSSIYPRDIRHLLTDAADSSFE